MKARHWSLVIILVLINYLIFATLLSRLFEADYGHSYPTRTPVPTFTPAPAQPAFAVPTLTPLPVIPTPTSTRVIPVSDANAAGNISGGDSLTVEPAGLTTRGPHLTAPGAVNIRSGPGVNYTVIGTLNANTPVPVIGRNGDASWWQIEITSGATGWVANTVSQASDTASIPVVDAPPPPPAAQAPAAQPAAAAPPPVPEKPKYQYEPTGWFDDGNAGLTRFMGTITDVAGNPVNGVFIEARCGTFSTISFPSGPVGWGPLKEGKDWPAGFYDLVVDKKPVPCIWTLTVVDTDDRQTVKAALSESIPVEITLEKSIVTANWRKNW